MDDNTLYLTITRGRGENPILATSDPRVLEAVGRVIAEILGASPEPVLRRIP